MRTLFYLLVSFLCLSACSKSSSPASAASMAIDRALEREGAEVWRDLGKFGDGMNGPSSMVKHEEFNLWQAEESEPKDLRRIEDGRRRLIRAQDDADRWAEFARPLLPEDRILEVVTRNGRVAYIVAIRDDKIVG